MASSPIFTGTVNTGSGTVPATADTSYTSPSNQTTVFTAGASGSRVEEIRLQGLGTTVAGLVNVFRYSGSTYHLIDQFTVPAQTASTTAAAYQDGKCYQNLFLSASDTIRVTTTVSGNVSLIKVNVYGGDF